MQSLVLLSPSHIVVEFHEGRSNSIRKDGIICRMVGESFVVIVCNKFGCRLQASKMLMVVVVSG